LRISVLKISSGPVRLWTAQLPGAAVFARSFLRHNGPSRAYAFMADIGARSRQLNFNVTR